MAIENELPHYTGDAAHALEAARLTIQAQAAELARIEEQRQQAEAHNNDVNNDLVQVRVWAQAIERAAINRLAQGTPDPRYWQGQADAARAVWQIVKPVV